MSSKSFKVGQTNVFVEENNNGALFINIDGNSPNNSSIRIGSNQTSFTTNKPNVSSTIITGNIPDGTVLEINKNRKQISQTVNIRSDY